MANRTTPTRILEIGPGTGAITRQIVKLMKPDDHLDLVELNPQFVELLEHRLRTEPEFQAIADRTRIHALPIQEFQWSAPYDIVISGLPMNNFSPGLVQEIFEVMFRLMAPEATLSYFEYMFVRQVRRLFAGSTERDRLRGLEQVIAPYIAEHRLRRSWVFTNFPPAWVQHLARRPVSKSPAN